MASTGTIAHAVPRSSACHDRLMPSASSISGTTPLPSVSSSPPRASGSGSPSAFSETPASAAQNGGTRASRSQAGTESPPEP